MILAHEPHEQRVLEERAELNQKLDRLNDFISMERFFSLDRDEQSRLRRQACAMKEYLAILDERIAAFPLPYGLVKAGT